MRVQICIHKKANTNYTATLAHYTATLAEYFVKPVEIFDFCIKKDVK
ncbi:MAG: hypothetical protein NTZ33_13910 [Bacteroidetes bacterium]|nr:hypothetical protein [Bacteroidota bacterium]